MEETTVKSKEINLRTIFVAAGLLLANPACAFDMGNMMNPSKWMNNNKNDDDRYYDDGPGYGYPGGPPGYGGAPGYGYGGAPGYGYGGAPGYGYGGDPGYGYDGGPGYGGAPGTGYGGAPGSGYGGDPGYGYGGGAPGYGASPAYGGAAERSAKEAEIMRLKQRLKQLEGEIK
jgi:hypothetical protein